MLSGTSPATNHDLFNTLLDVYDTGKHDLGGSAK
jgi:hypothetical protein